RGCSVRDAGANLVRVQGAGPAPACRPDAADCSRPPRGHAGIPPGTPTSPDGLPRARVLTPVSEALFMADVTHTLDAIGQGDPHAAEHLLPLVYEELRKLAAEKMAQEKPGQTLQATALVHEAYLRLVDVARIRHWNSRGHFFAAAAEAM